MRSRPRTATASCRAASRASRTTGARGRGLDAARRRQQGHLGAGRRGAGARRRARRRTPARRSRAPTSCRRGWWRTCSGSGATPCAATTRRGCCAARSACASTPAFGHALGVCRGTGRGRRGHRSGRGAARCRGRVGAGRRRAAPGMVGVAGAQPPLGTLLAHRRGPAAPDAGIGRLRREPARGARAPAGRARRDARLRRRGHDPRRGLAADAPRAAHRAAAVDRDPARAAARSGGRHPTARARVAARRLRQRGRLSRPLHRRAATALGADAAAARGCAPVVGVFPDGRDRRGAREPRRVARRRSRVAAARFAAGADRGAARRGRARRRRGRRGTGAHRGPVARTGRRRERRSPTRCRAAISRTPNRSCSRSPTDVHAVPHPPRDRLRLPERRRARPPPAAPGAAPGAVPAMPRARDHDRAGQFPAARGNRRLRQPGDARRDHEAASCS